MTDGHEVASKDATQPKGSAIVDAVNDTIDGNTVFGDLLSTVDRQFLLDHCVVRCALPGEPLCRQHQRDDLAFIIVVGEEEVTESVDGKVEHLATLGRGELFGEIAAIFNSPRLSTVTATRPSVLLEFNGGVLDTLIHRLPLLRDAVLECYRQRITETALRAVPLFSGLPRGTLEVLNEQTSL